MFAVPSPTLLPAALPAQESGGSGKTLQENAGSQREKLIVISAAVILKGACENSEPIQHLQDKRPTSYSGELQGITIWFGTASTRFCSFPWKSFTSFCCFVSSGFQYKDLLTPTDELVDFDFRHGMRK